MSKLFMVMMLALSMLVAKPIHKGGKPLNKGSINSSLKGANSIIKPNKYKKHHKDSKQYYKKGDKLEKEVTKAVVKTVL